MTALVLEAENQNLIEEILNEETPESSFIISIVKRRISSIIGSSNNYNIANNVLNMY